MDTMKKIHSLYSPLTKGIASELIKWLVGFWMDAMAWWAGWTPSVTDTMLALPYSPLCKGSLFSNFKGTVGG